MADNFSRLVPWVNAIAQRLSPAQMRKLSRKIGMALRRTNAQRIAANQTPEGSAMEPRKPRPKRELPGWLEQRIRANPALRAKFKKRRPIRNKMFPKIRRVSNMTVKPRADGVEVGFNSKMARGAYTHHFGLRDRVSRFRDAPQAKYPARPLLGFGPDDDDTILAAVLDQIDG